MSQAKLGNYLLGISQKGLLSIRERQFSYNISDMRNLKGRTGSPEGKGGKK